MLFCLRFSRSLPQICLLFYFMSQSQSYLEHCKTPIHFFEPHTFYFLVKSMIHLCINICYEPLVVFNFCLVILYGAFIYFVDMNSSYTLFKTHKQAFLFRFQCKLHSYVIAVGFFKPNTDAFPCKNSRYFGVPSRKAAQFDRWL